MTIHQEDGFTLIEALVAMVIFSIGILGLYAMQTTAILGNAKANTITLATNVASQVVEEIQSLEFADSALSSNSGDNPHRQGELTALHIPEGISSIDWRVVDWSADATDNDQDGFVDEPDETGMKHVTINVSYSSASRNGMVTVNCLKTHNI